MNGFGPPSDDDNDFCGCVMGKACSYHERREKESAAYAEVCYRAEGLDPKASVEGLEEVLFAVELSTHLSEEKKRRIRLIIMSP